MTLSHPFPLSGCAAGSFRHPPRGAPADPPAGAHPPPDASDLAGPRFECPCPDWLHPESEYEHRHANCGGGDLHAVPDFPRMAANRWRGAR